MANIELGYKLIKNLYIYGYFDTLEEAIKARKEAEEKYFKPILNKYKAE